jgi:FAD/FMN-containing dehydrogenase
VAHSLAEVESEIPERTVALRETAGERGLGIACRGLGHATSGQAQVTAGIALDSTTLATIHEIGPDGADVDAGASWRSLIEAALAQGLTPPTVTDYLDLSVGGTLCAGGIGGASPRHGAQIDNVLELEVVTGDGVRRTCTTEHDQRLFEAVLGGLGQFGIIVGARLRLVPAAPSARVYDLTYPALEAFTADGATLAMDDRFDHISGQAFASELGGWTWHLFAVSYHTPPDVPDNDALLAGLRDTRATARIEDVPYPVFLARLDPIVDAQRQLGRGHGQRAGTAVPAPAELAAEAAAPRAGRRGRDLPLRHPQDDAAGNGTHPGRDRRQPDPVRTGTFGGRHALLHRHGAVRPRRLAQPLRHALAGPGGGEAVVRPRRRPHAGQGIF